MPTDTIIALATPPGTGAIAVVRIAGPRAVAAVDELWGGKKKLADQASHTVHFGTIRYPAREGEERRILDEVLVTIFRAPNSYTGDEAVEISCHGGPYIVRELIRVLTGLDGLRLAQPGEYSLRAFLNGKLDLSQAEAVADLIGASSRAAHDLAVNQLRGGYSHELQGLRQRLIDFAALVELELDFGEEDVEFANREELKTLVDQIRGVVLDMAQSFALGNALKEGIRTAIVGRPNAGKSTLLNALLREERAIVSATPGTTRDTIEEVLNIDGIAFRLTDTAGIRSTEDDIEALGVERSRAAAAASRLLIYVFDVLETSPAQVHADLAEWAGPETRLLVVANKMDLNPYTRYEQYATPGEDGLPAVAFTEEQWVPMVAEERMNLGLLRDRIHAAALLNAGDTSDGTIVSNARHHEALLQTATALDDVLMHLREGTSGDFVALDIRRALHHLGEITGEVSTDDLLESIFGRFCIGK